MIVALFFAGSFLASCLDSFTLCKEIGGTVSGLSKCNHRGDSRHLVMWGSGNVRGMGVQPSNLQMIEAGDG